VSNYVIGESGGASSVTLTTNQIPSHNHPLNATSSGQQQAPSSSTMPADAAPANAHVYGPFGAAPTQLAAGTIGNAGGSQPHDNMQPYLAITFIISLFGIYPSPS
jgi:microcystin-dependent protein